MQTYNYLPGTIINTVDGGLTASFTPSDDAVLVLGTAGQGPVNTPFQVASMGNAIQTFGVAGSLVRGLSEVSTNSDNVIGYRIGASPLELNGVGADTTVGASTPGFNISFGTVTSDAASVYQIWYQAGVLAVWNDGEIVFSNQSGAAVDTGDVQISNAAGQVQGTAVAGNAGLAIGIPSTPITPGPFVATHGIYPSRARATTRSRQPVPPAHPQIKPKLSRLESTGNSADICLAPPGSTFKINLTEHFSTQK